MNPTAAGFHSKGQGLPLAHFVRVRAFLALFPVCARLTEHGWPSSRRRRSRSRSASLQARATSTTDTLQASTAQRHQADTSTPLLGLSPPSPLAHSPPLRWSDHSLAGARRHWPVHPFRSRTRHPLARTSHPPAALHSKGKLLSRPSTHPRSSPTAGPSNREHPSPPPLPSARHDSLTHSLAHS